MEYCKVGLLPACSRPWICHVALSIVKGVSDACLF